MTQEEIIEGNRLIADFMGAKPRKDYPEKELWIPIHGMVRHDTINFGKGRIIQYHKSWDWLMLVVEKIESLGGYGCTIYRNSIHFNAVPIGIANIPNIPNTSLSKMSVVYKGVMEFIKWYNQNKPQ